MLWHDRIHHEETEECKAICFQVIQVSRMILCFSYYFFFFFIFFFLLLLLLLLLN